MKRAGWMIAALAALSFACGSAFAAGASIAQDAAGEGPDMDEVTLSTHDPLTRAQVEQGLAGDPPAAGQESGVVVPTEAHDTLTRQSVENAVDRAAAQGQGFPDVSGNEPASMQK